MTNKFIIPLALLFLAGCQNYNDLALKVGAPPQDAVDLRAFEMRRYDHAGDTALLAAATATLQDLGFTISESAPDVGVLAAAKQRDAVEAGQVVGELVLTAVLAAAGAMTAPVWDKTQDIHVTLVVSPVPDSTAHDVRVSFDRYITNNQGVMWKTQLLTDKPIYQQFFQKLDTALQLQGAG